MERTKGYYGGFESDAKVSEIEKAGNGSLTITHEV